MVVTFFRKGKDFPSKGSKEQSQTGPQRPDELCPLESHVRFDPVPVITLSLFGSAMSYYFNYFVDKQSLYQFLKAFGLVVSDVNTPWQKFLDMFGLISKSDLSNVFAVGFSFFNMIGQLVTLVGVLFLSQFLSNLFGKRNVFLVCMTLTTLFTALFFFVDSKDIALIFVINILKNAAYAPTIPLLWAMMGDVADFSEWKNHRRATGFCFAGIVFA